LPVEGVGLPVLPSSRIQTHLGQEKAALSGRDPKLHQITLVGGFVLEEDVEAVKVEGAGIQVLGARVGGVAEEGLRRRVFARLKEAPQQVFDPPPRVLAGHRTGDFVAEDEREDGSVADVRFGRLLHRGLGLSRQHLLPSVLHAYRSFI
jgi:hypothetical protein